MGQNKEIQKLHLPSTTTTAKNKFSPVLGQLPSTHESVNLFLSALPGLPTENIHVSWVFVSTSNITKGEVQHSKECRIREHFTTTFSVFVFLPIKFIPHETIPMTILHPSLEILTTEQTKGFRQLNSHLLWEGIASLTEQVNIPLANFPSFDYHLPFPDFCS